MTFPVKKIITLFSLSVLLSAAVSYGDTKQIRFAFHKWPPVVYLDDNGRPAGLYYDLLSEVLEKKLDMVIIPQQLPWKRCQTNVRDGESDFILTVATDERLDYAVKSELPFYELYLYVFTYSGHPKLPNIRSIQSASDIKALDLIAVTNLGNGWHKAHIDSAGVTTRYLRQEDNSLKFLANKRADIMIDGLISTQKAIRQLGLSDKVVPTEARFGPIRMHLLISKKSPHVTMMPEINRAFSELKKQGVIDQITDRYHHPN